MTKPKILLVDDDALFRKALFRMLTYSGFDVVEAGPNDDMPEVIAREQIALVVLDLNMPGRCGEEILQTLKGREDVGIPIVVLSGSLTPEIGTRLMHAGASACVHKTVGPAALVATLQDALQG